MTKDGSGKLCGKLPPDLGNDEEAPGGGDGKPRASNKATTAVEFFSAEEPPKPPPGRGVDGSACRARSPTQKVRARSKKKLPGRDKSRAEEEKVEIVTPCEPFVVGSNLQDESDATKGRGVGTNSAAAASTAAVSAELPRWSIANQGQRHRKKEGGGRPAAGGGAGATAGRGRGRGRGGGRPMRTEGPGSGMTTQRSAQGKGSEGKINRYQRNDKAGGQVRSRTTRSPARQAKATDRQGPGASKAKTVAETFAAEEPPQPFINDNGRSNQASSKVGGANYDGTKPSGAHKLPPGAAAVRQKRLAQKEGKSNHHAEEGNAVQSRAEEEKVEVVAADEPLLVGAANSLHVRPNEESKGTASSAATPASAEPPHWSVAKQGRPRISRNGNNNNPDAGREEGDESQSSPPHWSVEKQGYRYRRNKTGRGMPGGRPSEAAGGSVTNASSSEVVMDPPEEVRPGAVAVAGPGGESSPVEEESDDNESGEAHALNAFVGASRRNNKANEGMLVEGVVVGDEPKIKRAECPRWLWLVGALIGVGGIATIVWVGTENFAPKSAAPIAPTAAPTAAVPTISPMPTPAWCPSNKVLPDDVSAFDHFGTRVAMDGDTAVVGAPLDDDNGRDSGSVYVFTRIGSTWELQDKLTPNDGAEYDYFGWSVAIRGDTAVVGAPYDNTNSGSAYVFVRTATTWLEQTKLTPNDGARGDEFGKGVAIDGNTIVVGGGTNSGSVSIFVRTGSTWMEQGQLIANDGAFGDRFGRSVAIDVDTIVVGAPFDDDNGSGSGSAYVFIRIESTWTQTKKLLAPDSARNDEFGHSVGLSGNTAIVGAPYDDTDNGDDSGSAHIIELC